MKTCGEKMVLRIGLAELETQCGRMALCPDCFALEVGRQRQESSWPTHDKIELDRLRAELEAANQRIDELEFDEDGSCHAPDCPFRAKLNSMIVAEGAALACSEEVKGAFNEAQKRIAELECRFMVKK